MKSYLMISLLTISAQASPMADRVTSDELIERRAGGKTMVIDLRSGEAEDVRARRPSDQSLIKQSLVLSDGTNWTLVPNGAVLHVPQREEARVGVRPIGNLLSWREFLTKNRNWLAAEDITLRQAEGVKPLDEDRVAHWAKQDRVIVAVHLGGPISVHLPEKEIQTVNHR